MPTTPRTPDRHFEHGQPLEVFQYDQVEFQPGLHEAQLEQTQSVLINMDEDSMLLLYRRHAGLSAPGCPMGGVYEAMNAETFGCFLSALARYYAIRKDESTRAKVERLVEGYARTIEPNGKMFEGYGNAVKYRRIARALMDVHQFTQNPIALNVLARTLDALIPRLPRKAGRDSPP